MRHVLIWGRRRQGKSTLALALAAIHSNRPILVFDPCAQYRMFPSIGPGDLDELEAAMQAESGEVPVLALQCGTDPIGDITAYMDVLDGGGWRWSEYTIILDEAALLQRPQGMPPAVARLIRQAPDDILVIETLHRPSETHGTIRALATDFFFFQCFHQRDLEVIEHNFGPDIAAKVRALGPHEVLHFWLGPAGEPCHAVWHDPALWYVQLREEKHPNEKP